MKKQKVRRLVDIPALETTVEGKLRGGFSNIQRSTNSRVTGGPNDECDRNSVCSDNLVCYDNHDSQACAGNHATSCSSMTSSSTSVSSPTSSLISIGLGNIFSAF